MLQSCRASGQCIHLMWLFLKTRDKGYMMVWLHSIRNYSKLHDLGDLEVGEAFSSRKLPGNMAYTYDMSRKSQKLWLLVSASKTIGVSNSRPKPNLPILINFRQFFGFLLPWPLLGDRHEANMCGEKVAVEMAKTARNVGSQINALGRFWSPEISEKHSYSKWLMMLIDVYALTIMVKFGHLRLDSFRMSVNNKWFDLRNSPEIHDFLMLPQLRPLLSMASRWCEESAARWRGWSHPGETWGSGGPLGIPSTAIVDQCRTRLEYPDGGRRTLERE